MGPSRFDCMSTLANLLSAFDGTRSANDHRVGSPNAHRSNCHHRTAYGCMTTCKSVRSISRLKHPTSPFVSSEYHMFLPGKCLFPGWICSYSTLSNLKTMRDRIFF